MRPNSGVAGDCHGQQRTLAKGENRPGAVLRHRSQTWRSARSLVRRHGLREHAVLKNHTGIGGKLMVVGRSYAGIG